MLIHSLRWDREAGWSGPFPAVDSTATFIVVFGAPALIDDPAPIAELASAFPLATITGCSTSGEISGEAVYDGSLSVSIARFDDVQLTSVHLEVSDAERSHDAGAELARRLCQAQPALKAVFVLSDGLGVNGSMLVAGLTGVLEDTVVVTGGLAGDGDRFERTWVLVDGEPRSGHVCAVGLSGPNLAVGYGSQGGWEIFGPERRITRAEGNVLYELDGQPALELYKKYLGERAEGLPATALLFPLALRIPGAESRQVVRTVLATDEATQSMTFAGDVPEGSLAQLMRASFDRLVDGAEAAAEHAGIGEDVADDSPVLAVAISCVGRRLVLGRRVEDELEATRSALPEDTTMVGFYSYGEICQVGVGECDLHNQTMTVTTFQERTAVQLHEAA